MDTMLEISKIQIERAKSRLANAYIYLHQINATDRQKSRAKRIIAECQLTIMQYSIYSTFDI